MSEQPFSITPERFEKFQRVIGALGRDMGLDAASVDDVIQDTMVRTIEAYDPEADLDEAQEAVDEALSSIQALDPEADLESYVDTALNKIDGVVLTSSMVTALVNAYEDKITPTLMRSMNRVAGLLDFGRASVGNTGMTMAIASKEKAFNNNVAAFRAQIEAQNRQLRATLMSSYVGEMGQAQARKISALDANVQKQLQVDQAKIIAMTDKFSEDLTLDVKEALFDPEVLMYAGQWLGAVSGMPVVPPAQSKLASGLATGLATGAAGAHLAAPLGGPMAMLAALSLGAIGTVVGAGAAQNPFA